MVQNNSLSSIAVLILAEDSLSAWACLGLDLICSFILEEEDVSFTLTLLCIGVEGRTPLITTLTLLSVEAVSDNADGGFFGR